MGWTHIRWTVSTGRCSGTQAVIEVSRWRGVLLAPVRWIPWAGRRIPPRPDPVAELG